MGKPPRTRERAAAPPSRREEHAAAPPSRREEHAAAGSSKDERRGAAPRGAPPRRTPPRRAAPPRPTTPAGRARPGKSPAAPPQQGERLQKLLAAAGVASRRAAEEMIASGRVSLNGQVVTQMGLRASPSDRIEVDGHPIAAGSPSGAADPGKAGPETASEHVYILLHKPAGVVSTARDTHGRKTVLDVLEGAQLKERGLRLYPVGRLDAESTGLILITNDGDLTFRLTHPRYGIEKEYRVLVRGHPTQSELQKLREGVEIEGELTAPARVEDLGRRGTDSWLRVVIHEGHKRQVRLMVAAVGHPVIELQRVRYGPLVLGNLEPGRWRYLAKHEVHALQKATGLRRENAKRKT
ncbi:MAG: pseudouridine synthase [Chloroflexia bacterium]